MCEPHAPPGASREAYVAALFDRNKRLVDAAHWGVAFYDGQSRGTAFTMDYARKAGKLRHVFLARRDLR